MAAIRRAVEMGLYPNPDPRASQAVINDVLRVLQTTKSPRTKLSAAKTHASLMRLNIQMLEALSKIDAAAAATEAPTSDIIRLPSGGPWGSIPPSPDAEPEPEAEPSDEPETDDGPDDRSI